MKRLLLALVASCASATEFVHLPADGSEARPIAGEVVLAPGDELLIRPTDRTGTQPRRFEFESFTLSPPSSCTLRPLRASGPAFRPIALDPPHHSEAWSRQQRRIEGLPATWESLKLSFDLPSGGMLRLRELNWLPAGSETAPASGRRGHVPSAVLEAELNHSYPARIDLIEVAPESIILRGNTAGLAAPLNLAEIPMDRLLDDPERFEELLPVEPSPDGSFSLEVPRRRTRSGLDYDRLTSRWRLVMSEDQKVVPCSNARYPDKVSCRHPDLPVGRLRGKKGLGGWHTGQLPGEIPDLGIHAVTVNIVVDSILTNGPKDNETIPFSWQGRRFHANRQVVNRLDATFREAMKHDLVVSAILLVANPALTGKVASLAHPDARSEGTYAMPDVVSEEGIATYGGLLNFIAERWSRPDGKFGRVHHWIIHNEVDAGWTWTNAGEIPALPFMDLYQRSMRLTDLIVRQYDPHARPFISLTHHWADPGSPKFYGSKNMLELLVRFTRAEGDFPWALAHHPYPQSLRNPRTWEDDQATFGFDTKKITPRNIEVLDAWMKRPDMLHEGRTRPVHLSENGFNSPDYTPKSLTDQAAGMAYAWKKIMPLETIGVWHYHNWIDNRAEGGLRIGLRRFPDAPGAPLAPKPIWHLYQALGTDREAAVADPYLQTIGIEDWSSIHRPLR